MAAPQIHGLCRMRTRGEARMKAKGRDVDRGSSGLFVFFCVELLAFHLAATDHSPALQRPAPRFSHDARALPGKHHIDLLSGDAVAFKLYLDCGQ
jgi:hypothetical protein